MEISFTQKSFGELETYELYEILKLRTEVFIVEQNCPYQDEDDKDQLAVHIMGWDGKILVAYARIFPAGVYFRNASISRVIIRPGYRGTGSGHELMDASIFALNDRFSEYEIEISAQAHLQRFYEHHLFSQVSEPYLEDGIPHIRMIRNLRP